MIEQWRDVIFFLFFIVKPDQEGMVVDRCSCSYSWNSHSDYSNGGSLWNSCYAYMFWSSLG